MFWNNKQSENTTKAVDYNSPVKSDDGYTVGVDDDGKTVVRVSCRGFVHIITMNESGVRRMIRLLEATLPQDSASEERSSGESASS